MTDHKSASPLRQLLQSESSGGLLLIAAAALALWTANSSLAPFYHTTLHIYVLGLSLEHWINDGLMAIFFLLVGLEIKREMSTGELASWSRRALPGVAALGGMIVPALIYVVLNWHQPANLKGWAVPVATDIAFALGILSLLGSRVPPSLKIFLTALAIIDDLGAVIIIGVFYTSDLAAAYLGGAAAMLTLLFALNRFGVRHLAIYCGLGCILWYLVLKSGIHPSIAGVALALTVPLASLPAGKDATSPLLTLEHFLQPWVAFLIVPVFGFANAGLSLTSSSGPGLMSAVPLGIALGLFLGKQLGVFGFCWLAIKAGFAHKPMGASWSQLYGVALLCGIGFTMSLFIGNLAFPTAPELQDVTKFGVLLGSVLSALAGAAVLWAVGRRV